MKDLYTIIQQNKNNIIIYGAGTWGIRYLEVVPNPVLFCDSRAEEIKEIKGIPCIHPSKLSEFCEGRIILICIADPIVSSRVKNDIIKECHSCDVYEAVTGLHYDDYSYEYFEKKELHVNIVCEDKGWILWKFAKKLEEYLVRENIKVTITDREAISADVNHYITFESLGNVCLGTKTIRTTMITHVDNLRKKDLIEMQANNGVVGICMSNDTYKKVLQWGVPADKICYINPAQDGDIHPRKTVLGITNRCYSNNTDYRKRDDFIVEVMKELQADLFKIKIMGSGWDEIVRELEEMGVEVEYYNSFNRDRYIELLHSLDYWIYYGVDEGAMGFLDAVAAGVKTIATPQGFHLDVQNGLTHSINTIRDCIEVLRNVEEEKIKKYNSIRFLTWDNYAKKHAEIWRYLSNTIEKKGIFKHQSEYVDGIYSLLIRDNRV